MATSIIRTGWLAWVLVAIGAGGVMLDSAFPLPVLLTWASYVLCVAGAVLFSLSHLLRSPPPPDFVAHAPDPWENDRSD